MLVTGDIDRTRLARTQVQRVGQNQGYGFVIVIMRTDDSVNLTKKTIELPLLALRVPVMALCGCVPLISLR